MYLKIEYFYFGERVGFMNTVMSKRINSEKNYTWLKIFTTITFLLMVTVNALANIIPINGVGTGEVSDSYKNLFAPAGLTFSIWGVIYLLLAGFILYQFSIFRQNKSTSKQDIYSSDVLRKVAVYFSISSIANTAWIFAWHYKYIGLSMLLMIVILVCLILIAQALSKENLKGNFFIRLVFGVYFGWITVATIANATTLLVSLGWDGFGISEVIWTIIIIAVGVIIGIATMLKFKDIPYGLVIIWAYFGILIKHTSPDGFNGKYPAIITTVIVSIIALFIAEVLLVIKQGDIKQGDRHLV
jgi:hypothetical protein